MNGLTPEQQNLAERLLNLVRNPRYHFIYIESPGAVYGTPWDVSDDDWEKIEGFDLGSEENVRAIVEKALVPLATDETPIYFGNKPMESKRGLQHFIDVEQIEQEPLSAELLVFWQKGAANYYPPDTRVHITKRDLDWVRPESA